MAWLNIVGLVYQLLWPPTSQVSHQNSKTRFLRFLHRKQDRIQSKKVTNVTQRDFDVNNRLDKQTSDKQIVIN